MDEKHLFDNPRNVKRLLWLIYAICTGLVLLDFVFHRHVVHDLESIPGFYAIYGFGGCALLVLVAFASYYILRRGSNDAEVNQLKSN